MRTTLVRNGRQYHGRTPQSIIRRIFGRDAEVIYSPDPNSPRPVMAVYRDQYGTRVLGEFTVYTS